MRASRIQAYRALPLLAAFGSVTLLAACWPSGGAGDGDTPTPVTCTHGGATYGAGSTFEDDCNTCTCDSEGQISCTEMACGNQCESGLAAVCLQDSALGDCAQWGCPDCDTNAECDASDAWCRLNQDGLGECTPFVGPGDSCQGYVLPWTRQKCAPELMCVPREATGDIPGTCATCNYDGTPYQDGESFAANDGCNTCICDEDGQVACTEMACIDSCHYLGEDYAPGDGFTSYDGCNTCGCMDAQDESSTGQIGCTKIGCTQCPDGTEEVQCFADPCETTSCDVEGARCVSDYCGGCNARWFGPKGNSVCE